MRLRFGSMIPIGSRHFHQTMRKYLTYSSFHIGGQCTRQPSSSSYVPILLSTVNLMRRRTFSQKQTQSSVRLLCNGRSLSDPNWDDAEHDHEMIGDHECMGHPNKNINSSDEGNEAYSEICSEQKLYIPMGKRQSVLILQPKIKWGKNRMFSETTDMKLAEAVALVETLPGWKVCEKIVVPVHSYTLNKARLFGTGKLDELKQIISKNKANITCVLINVDMLAGPQYSELSNFWRLPLFDRYNLVLQIFKTYANTAEAKLQISLAEIPYLRTRIKSLQGSNLEVKDSGFAQQLDSTRKGGGEGRWARRKELLRNREADVRRKIEKLRQQRDLNRTQRRKRSVAMLPMVAVIGYTNSGKTSLIKCLTQDKRLVPLNRLFATLDSTMHHGMLPNKVNVIYVDTIGFISDLPTELIASFQATLDEIRNSDVLVHVRDVSNPDTISQKEKVLETLGYLDLPQHLMDNMVEVCNKVDLVSDTDLSDIQCAEDSIFTSCVQTNIGFGDLNELLELRVAESTNSFTRTFKVPIGGEHYNFLCREAAITDTVPSEDAKYLFVTAIMTPATMGKFNSTFGTFKKRVPKSSETL